MSFDWNQYLTIAAELAKRGDECSSRVAVSRAYYAAYWKARKYVEDDGYRKSHRFVALAPHHEFAVTSCSRGILVVVRIVSSSFNPIARSRLRLLLRRTNYSSCKLLIKKQSQGHPQLQAGRIDVLTRIYALPPSVAL
jgi:hypothetical protein